MSPVSTKRLARRRGRDAGSRPSACRCGSGSPKWYTGSGSTTRSPTSGRARCVAQELALAGRSLVSWRSTAEQIDAGRQRQREVARVLHRRVAGQHQRLGLVDRAAAHELARPLRVVLEHQRRDADHAGARRRRRRGRRRNMRPKPSRPSYQSWLPGMPSRTAAPAVVGQTPRSTWFQGTITRFGISCAVATGYAVSPPKNRMSPRGAVRNCARAIRIGQLVGREHQARHRAAHRHVVAGVGDEIDVDVAPQSLGQAARLRDRRPAAPRSARAAPPARPASSSRANRRSRWRWRPRRGAAGAPRTSARRTRPRRAGSPARERSGGRRARTLPPGASRKAGAWSRPTQARGPDQVKALTRDNSWGRQQPDVSNARLSGFQHPGAK